MRDPADAATEIAPGLRESHPDRDRNAAISRAVFDALDGTGDPLAIHHTVQVTSFGGSGTTALCEHLAEAGVDLPGTPGYFPFKHQRVPPDTAQVPDGYTAVYLVGDPRDAIVSIFRRGFQIGHYIAMRMALPSERVESHLSTLEAFLDAGTDEFALESHFEAWTDAHDRGYAILVVRLDKLSEGWPALVERLPIPRDTPPPPTVTRSSDWRSLPSQMRKRVDEMYGALAARVESLAPVHIVGSALHSTSTSPPTSPYPSSETEPLGAGRRPPRRRQPFSVTFLVPTTKRPIGGVMALFEFANALCRRGHQVNIVHLRTIKGHIDNVADIDWVQLDPRLRHHLIDTVTAGTLPEADFVELTGLVYFTDSDLLRSITSDPRSPVGRPFVFVQGWGLFPEAVELRALAVAGPKLCVARWLLDVASAHGVPQAELAHVPYGLRHEKYRTLTPIDSRPMQVSMLYSVHGLKGSADGIAALSEVQSRVPGTRVVLFGNQDPIHAMPADFVYLRNPPQQVLVDSVYNRSRVFLAPSVAEGFGCCPVEAMACGAALVTTSNGGSDDYAVADENALVCEPRDVTAMAANVERLLLDDDLCTTLARRGSESVARFDWDRSGAILEEVLHRYAVGAGLFGVDATDGTPRP